MRKLLKKLFSPSTKADSRLKTRKRKSKGQSLVEMTLTLPILLMLFSGMVEFGFMLNYYLSLVDATRYAARFYSNSSPFYTTGPNIGTVDSDFYANAAAAVKGQLGPNPLYPNDNTKKIVLDPAHDDVIVTVYSVYSVSGSTTIITIPTAFSSGCGLDNAYHMYCKKTSSFSPTSLGNQLVSGAPCEGMLLVEVDYTYHPILGLPWMKWLDGQVLHAYTIMPNISAAPGAPYVSLPAC